MTSVSREMKLRLNENCQVHVNGEMATVHGLYGTEPAVVEQRQARLLAEFFLFWANQSEGDAETECEVT